MRAERALRALSLQSIRHLHHHTHRQETDLKMEKAVILVVENEAIIRMSAVQMVEDAGFSATEACNADEAIAILENRRDIRAVFTDINMSGSMDGLKLAHAIRGRWPPIHLVVTSGRTGQNETNLPANTRFIRKPYAATQVAAALRELFGLKPAPPVNDNGHRCARIA
jgi:CheY-like chemotaxis protein